MEVSAFSGRPEPLSASGRHSSFSAMPRPHPKVTKAVEYRQTALIREMTDTEFRRLGDFIHQRCGIKMPASKKMMLQTRLQKRLRMRNFTTFTQYADYVFSGAADHEELFCMIDAVTTNKTDFFREPRHFDYMRAYVLSGRNGGAPGGFSRPMKFWSAGCSTGEEPYTLAMILAEHALASRSFDYAILGTDISTRVLNKAVKGIYAEDRVAPVPFDLKKKYLLKNRKSNLLRIVPELRARVTFQRLNFMDENFPLGELFDVVFCRNVIIYFDRPTQEEIVGRICRYIAPGGYLFMGHSETLSGMRLPLEAVASTVYRKGDEGS
jgi:chemotaxis protein methyltransferase CheR